MNAPVKVIPLGEVVNPTRLRVRPSEHARLPFIGMEHVEAHTMKLLGTVPAHTMKSAAVPFKAGDVLYGRLRPYLNKVFQPTFEGLCSAEFIVFPSNDRVQSAYLRYFLNSSAFVRYASRLNAGDRPRVDFDQLAPYPIPLPAIPMQRRIVAEIEKQFSRLDEAVANLKRVKVNLKRYCAAVLRAAVEGRLVPTEADLAKKEGRRYESGAALVERIREIRQRSKSYEKRRASEIIDEVTQSTLPHGWALAHWDEIGTSQNGRAFPSKDYCGNGVKLLRPGNLHESGVVMWTVENTRHLPSKYANANPDHIIREHELVMNLTAQSLKDDFLGRTCLTGLGEHCLLNQRLARLRPVEILPKFALIVFKSELFRRFVDQLSTGSLIQHMFTSQIARFPFPVPPLSEQGRIGAEVERHLSIARAIEGQAEANLKRVQALRQAVLARALPAARVPKACAIRESRIAFAHDS